MGMLRTGVAKIGLAVLVAVAGASLAAQSAYADRGGWGGGSGRHYGSGGGGGGRHYGGGGGSHFHGGGGHFHGGPRVVVRPGYYPHYPRRYYYYAPGPYYYSPYYYSPYYYPPAYYPPPVAYAPPVLPSMNSGYQYYCPSSQVYYPQVLECTAGWVQVSPSGGPPPG